MVTVNYCVLWAVQLPGLLTALHQQWDVETFYVALSPLALPQYFQNLWQEYENIRLFLTW